MLASYELLEFFEEKRKALTQPAWGGPANAGITQSKVDRWLECPFRAYIYLILGLEENVPLHPNLVWGSIFHKGLEHYLVPGTTISEATDKMREYQSVAYPGCTPTFKYTTTQMLKLYNRNFVEAKGIGDDLETEAQFDVEEKISLPGLGMVDIRWRGKADGLSRKCRYGVEHKCKGNVEFLQSRIESPIDKQVLFYAKMLNIRHWTYDIIRIPEAKFQLPPRRPGETNEHYAQRLFHSCDGKDLPIARNHQSWLHQFHFETPYNMIEDFLMYTWYPLISRMYQWWNWVTSDDFSLLDPRCYGELFYITPIRHFDPSNTEKYKCKYWDTLTGNTEPENLIPVTSFYSELEEV